MWSFSVATLVWLGAPDGRAQPQPTAGEAQRTALFEEGLHLAEAGRWAEAVERFQRVVAIRSAPRARFTLGQAEEKSGRLASAKASYALSLEEARQTGDEEAAGAAGAALAAIERRVPRLVVQLPPGVAGAQTSVDGRHVELSDQGMELDPGEHRVVVRAPGHKPFDQAVATSEGRTTELRVQLEPELKAAEKASSAEAAVPRANVSDDPGLNEDPWGPPAGAWILGTAGLAATAGGAVLYVIGQGAYDEAAAACSEAGCAAPGNADDGNAARGQMIAGDVVLGVGLGALAGAAVWWAVSAGQAPTEPARPRLGLAVNSNGLAVTVGGQL